MQDEIKVSEGYQPTHQFISFVEGSSSEAPDESSYPLQVLEADHNLNHLDGETPQMDLLHGYQISWFIRVVNTGRVN